MDLTNDEDLTSPIMTAGNVFAMPAPSLHLYSYNQEIIRISHDGKIYHRGKLVESDKEVADAFREFAAFQTRK